MFAEDSQQLCFESGSVAPSLPVETEKWSTRKLVFGSIDSTTVEYSVHMQEVAYRMGSAEKAVHK
jgi:hypothetical protein